MPKKRAKAKESAKPEAEVPAGMVLVSELAKEAGITTVGMRHRLNAAGVKMKRIEGRGRPSAVDANDARAKLQKRGDGRRAQKRDPRSGHSKPTETELRKLHKVAKAAPQSTSQTGPQQDRFARIENLAKVLKMDEGDIDRIKRQGNIKGGFGWVNATQLEAYMASEEYKQSLEA